MKEVYFPEAQLACVVKDEGYSRMTRVLSCDQGLDERIL